MPEYLTVMTTTDDHDKAQALAKSAVQARVAACAQVDAPISSVYWWEGAVGTATEWRILFKTTAERYPELEAHIKENHDYDTPEIIATPITRGSDAYLAWVSAETTAG